MRLICIALLASVMAAGALEPWQDVLLVRHARMGAVSNGFGLPQEANIVAYYPLDGTAYDEISQTTGTWGSDVTQTNDAIRGTAASMNKAANSYITTVNSTLLLGEWAATMSVWVKIRTYQQYGGLVVCYDAAGYESLGQHTPSSVLRARWGASTSAAGDFNLPAYDEWVNIIQTVDLGGGVFGKSKPGKIYVNGIESATMSAMANGVGIRQFDYFKIGYDDFTPARKTDGIFDELVIWNVALTSNEVYQVYQRDTP